MTNFFLLQIGKTKVFLRAGQMAELDACRAEVLGRSAIIIQKKGRTYICERQYKLLRFSAIELQRAVRGINNVNPSKLFIVVLSIILIIDFLSHLVLHML